MKVVITQPNYAWFSKRAWKLPPYSMVLLNGCLDKKDYDVQLLDPNYDNMTEEEVYDFFKKSHAQVVGVSSVSTEYIHAARKITAIIKKALPNAIVVQGGVIPTVILDIAMKDENVDYWAIGEGEYMFPRLLNELKAGNRDLSSIQGLAYWKNGIAKINPPSEFIENLDSIPFPDYGNLNLLDYGNQVLKYSAGLLPRQFPYAVTLTSRGCPYQCIFCAASTVSGRRIRFRSAENILQEVDMLYKSGIKEIIFLDDHFLGSRKRAIEFMKGLLEREYNLTWKCANLAINHLDSEILELMKRSGSYQMTLSIESGNQHILNNVIKKPIKLAKVPEILDMAKSFGFEIIANFIIGFPYETWEQIRETFRFADSINVDIVNFHLATPLPKTELMNMCIKTGCLPKDFNIEESPSCGYGKGLINTEEFTSAELEILRAFEWDRINFATSKRREAIARIEGITMEELAQWRINTRRKCGVNVIS